jgi:uncharacterized repeat protein (TIGR03803 family)
MSYWKKVCLGCALFGAMTLPSSAQFRKLVDFTGPNGDYPEYMSLVQGTDGDLYGTTSSGGAGGGSGAGTVFRITPNGALTTIHSFSGSEGGTPYAGLLLGTDGVFYGTTRDGGSSSSCSSGCGTIFKVTRTGTLTTLHNFDASDGASPVAAVIQGTDGDLYGTAEYGGSGACTYGGISGCGTVFKINSKGILTTLHSFNSTDGSFPRSALIQATDGNFYGTTVGGGANNAGTVFRLTTGGVLTTIYNFCSLENCADGEAPFAGLLQASDGDFYGTTVESGSYDCNNGGSVGTIFKLTMGGVFTVLTSDCYPEAPVIQGTDGSLYVTTAYGGNGYDGHCTADFNDGCGTVFKLTPSGQGVLLHTFNYTDGYVILGGLFQATNGAFYGTANEGGAGDSGTIFRLSGGIGPFIAFVQPTGKVGKTAQILGQGLTGTSSVTFNGVAATKFSVVSDTYMTAVVPAGATTGAVVVATPAGNLTSNVSFRITH